ncbi:hypothetical protein DUI87_19266 [Hirundo rustica rustica]|uniref:Uncharacterized protein n=1 Tax=Hirundo rustica rustica TaxID=333673 RepID=A0A3M0JSZ1_HIRRU|nr:hypothetical protein DUI87_19266 [Hirundo rustica rustica]
MAQKRSDVLTLQYQPLTIKNTCWLPLDLMLSLEQPFQVCSVDEQPLPDGQPVTVDAKQTCHLYIAFDPAYKLDFNSWKEKKVLKVEMVRGHPSVEQITLWGEAHFPNLQIQPSTLEFRCIVAGAEEVHSLEMTNCSPLPVKYHGAFQTDSQANRLTYELHPLKFKPEPPKGTSIYVDNPATQWRRFRTRNVEEPATTLEESRDLAQSSGAEDTKDNRKRRYKSGDQDNHFRWISLLVSTEINISTTHPGSAISCIVPPYRSIQTPDTGTCMINEDASEGKTSESRTSLHDLVYKKGRLETEIVNLGG